MMDSDRVYHLAHVLKSLALLGIRESPVEEAQNHPTVYLIDYCLENGGTLGLAREIFAEKVSSFRLNGGGLRMTCRVLDKHTGNPYVRLNVYDEGKFYPETTRMMNEFIAECGLAA